MLTTGLDGFDNDLKARSLVRPIPVYYDAHQDPTSPEVLQAFEAKLDKMKESGAQPVRAVILCNPHNPLGTYRLGILTSHECSLSMLLRRLLLPEGDHPGILPFLREA